MVTCMKVHSPYQEIPHGSRKEWAIDTCNILKWPQSHCAEGTKEPISQGGPLSESIYARFPKWQNRREGERLLLYGEGKGGIGVAAWGMSYDCEGMREGDFCGDSMVLPLDCDSNYAYLHTWFNRRPKHILYTNANFLVLTLYHRQLRFFQRK